MLKPSLRNRFILYFLPLISGILIQGGYCVYTFSTIHNHFDSLQQDAAANASAMLDLKNLLLSIEAGMRERIIDRNMLAEKAAQLNKIITAHTDHTHQESDSAEKVAHEMQHHDIFVTTLSKYILNEAKTGWQTAEFSEIADAIQEELTALELVIDQHLQLHLQQLSTTEEFVNEKYQHALVVITLTSAAVILLTILVFILMMRSILGPVKILQEGTRQIGTGNLGYRVRINTGDEFEFLAREFAKMAEELSRYHEDLETKVLKRTAALQQAKEQVQNLSQKLLTVQENERQQISLYLHDNVAQNLSSLKISGEALLRDAAEGDMPGQQEIHDWTGLLDHCIKTVRELSYNLRPPGLEQIGLASAIADYCRDFSKKNNMVVHFTRAGVDNLQFEFDDAINVYRLVQEGLNNVKKHAAATKAEIRLIASHPNIILRMEDDGCGFEPEQGYRKALENKRFGLLGMEERVRMMQGVFKVHSAPEKGTKIIVEFPGPVAPEELTDNIELNLDECES